MAYCTLNDIKLQIYEDELIRLTDELGIGEIAADKVDTAIQTAEGEVNIYLGNREEYILPLNPVPAVITNLTVDLAIRNLYLLNPGGVPTARDRQAENAVRLLDKIAQGKLSLGVGDPNEGAVTDNASFGSTERMFTRAKMRGL